MGARVRGDDLGPERGHAATQCYTDKHMTSPALSVAPITDTQRRLGTAAICLATLAQPLDSSVNVAFPDIVNSFDLPIADIQWVVISYTLTYAALMLVCGRAGDLFGHRPIFLLGCATGALAFVFCAIAPTYGWLLAARVLQGVGAALSLSCGPALITALYPEDQRTRVLGVYTLIFGVGGALGPLVGGPLVQDFGWPAVYAFRVPIALGGLAMGLALPSGSRRAGGSFDILGATLLVVAIAALLLALNQLQHAENIMTLAALFALFVVLSAAFIVQQRRSLHPVVDLKYFRSADFSLLNIGSMALNLGAFAIWLFVPFYLDRIARLPLGAIGLVLAIAPVGSAIAAPIAGRFAAKIHARRLAVIGAVAVAAGGLMIGIDIGGVTGLALGALLQGLGLGFYQVAYFDISTATLPAADRGVAGSLVMMTRTLGIVIGATVLTLVFQRLSANATAGGADVASAFVSGFDGVFRFAAALSAAIVVAAVARGWMRSNAVVPAKAGTHTPQQK
jgi:EmrB/QacA subfamily drug resistance transporter